MMSVEPLKLLFTADQFERLGQAGILSEDDRVELIEGEIVWMVPIGPPHASTVDRLNRLFTARLGERAIVRVQSPIRLDDLSEPQPDVAVLRPQPDFYSVDHPLPPDVFLVVEVGESSLLYDRRRKLPLYARSGIGEVWLVDLTARHVEVYRQPGPTGYASVMVEVHGHSVPVPGFPDARVPVEEILGPISR